MSSSAYWSLALAGAIASCSLAAPNGGAGAGPAVERKLAQPRVCADAAAGEDAVCTARTRSAGGDTGVAGATAQPSDCAPHGAVLGADLSNARDLVGTPLSPSGAVACGVAFRGPPLSLSRDGCADAAELGIHTVLDLRIEGERLGAPDADCVGTRQVLAPLPVPYGLGPTDYLNDLHATASMAVAFHAFGDPEAYPIYFHCTFGRDRTGVVAAVLLLALGATRDGVMAEYLLSGPNVGAYPESLDAVLDEIEQRGGVETVLRDLGITSAELAVMRARLVAD